MADEVPFTEPVAIAGAGLDLFQSAQAADLNGDLATDALYTFRDRNTGEYGIAWNESNFPGSNGPDPLTRWLVVDQSNDVWEAVVAADFDGDGDQDVCAVEEDGMVLFANETGLGRTGDWEDFTVTATAQDSPSSTRPGTQAVHAGPEPDPYRGGVSVPIYQSSTFRFQDTDEGAGPMAA